MLTDLDAWLALMDQAGVRTQILSVNPGQYYYWAGQALAADLAGVINEHLAAQAALHPDRLLALGTVALQHPELAATQLTHAVRTLGLVGVQISSHAGGRDLSSAEFEPLWDAAEEWTR